MSLFLYTVFYMLFTGCLVYPPTEFISAGVTLNELISPFLGSELNDFIHYHIKRSALTLLVHSALPFGYIFGATLFGHFQDTFHLLGGEFTDGSVMTIVSLLIPLYFLYKCICWRMSNWSTHIIAKRLSIYCNERLTWTNVVEDINSEYRRIDKLQIVTNSTTRIVVTNKWVIKINAYDLDIASQINSLLVMYNVNMYASNTSTTGNVVYAKYRIVTRQPGGRNFTIRVHANDIPNLLDKITMPKRTLTSDTIPKTLTELRIEAIKEEVLKNPRYKPIKELEQCVVCMNAMANVKLIRQCPNIPAMDGIPACEGCNCSPLYCIDCLSKWFLSGDLQQKQLENISSMKSTCPQCRSTFCILDVNYVDTESTDVR